MNLVEYFCSLLSIVVSCSPGALIACYLLFTVLVIVPMKQPGFEIQVELNIWIKLQAFASKSTEFSISQNTYLYLATWADSCHTDHISGRCLESLRRRRNAVAGLICPLKHEKSIPKEKWFLGFL